MKKIDTTLSFNIDTNSYEFRIDTSLDSFNGCDFAINGAKILSASNASNKSPLVASLELLYTLKSDQCSYTWDNALDSTQREDITSLIEFFETRLATKQKIHKASPKSYKLAEGVESVLPMKALGWLRPKGTYVEFPHLFNNMLSTMNGSLYTLSAAKYAEGLEDSTIKIEGLSDTELRCANKSFAKYSVAFDKIKFGVYDCYDVTKEFLGKWSVLEGDMKAYNSQPNVVKNDMIEIGAISLLRHAPSSETTVAPMEKLLKIAKLPGVSMKLYIAKDSLMNGKVIPEIVELYDSNSELILFGVFMPALGGESPKHFIMDVDPTEVDVKIDWETRVQQLQNYKFSK